MAVQLAERGEPVRLSRKLLSLVARETLAVGLSRAMAPLGWGQPTPARTQQGQDQRPPVLLLPGYRLNRSILFGLHTFLSRRGFSWVWPVSLSRGKRIADHAADLARHVATLKATTGAEQIDIVGFSMGGLVAGWYVQHLDGAPHVRRLVTIGTPWRGTKMSVFGRNAVARDGAWRAPILDGLTPVPVGTLSIWSPEDPLVVPATSAAPDAMDSVRIDGAGHTEMMFSARVYRAVYEALLHSDEVAMWRERDALATEDAG